MRNLIISTLFTALFCLSSQAKGGTVDTTKYGLRLSPEATQVLRAFATDFDGPGEFNENHISIIKISYNENKIDAIYVTFRVELAPYESDPGRTLFCDGYLEPKDIDNKISWALKGQRCVL